MDEIYEIPVNDYPNQVQNFELFGYNLQFTLRFNPVGVSWAFDLYDNVKSEYIVKNEGLSISMPSLFYTSLPFVIVLVDNANLGYETVSISEMGQRLSIVAMSKEAYTNAIG